MRSWQLWWIGSTTCQAEAGDTHRTTPAAAASPTCPAARRLTPNLLSPLDLRLLLAPVERTEHPLDDDVGRPVPDRQLRRLAVADVVLDRILDALREGGVAAEEVDLLVAAVR